MNPQTCTKFGANRSSRLLDFPDFCIFDPLNPQNSPLGIEGLIVFSICPFPDESADGHHIWCQSIQPFGRFSRLFNFVIPKSPQNAPCGIGGLIVLAYVQSQMNPQTCNKFGANRYRRLVDFPDFCIFDPPKTPQVPPLGLEELIVYSLCPFPDESAHVCQILC